MIFGWDAGKAAKNAKKHGVTFEDATDVFADDLALTFDDPDHSENERREITIGHTKHGAVIFVSHCERARRMRIISARRATARERRQYEESINQS